MNDRTGAWYREHPPLPPTTQSERAQKSMLPPGYQNRQQRRQRFPLHSANYHQQTRGAARTRDIVQAGCHCVERSKWRQTVRRRQAA